MWDGFDKRKFPRIQAKCEIKVYAGEASEPLKTVTENVGMGGVCVILDKGYDRFTPCKVKIELNQKTAIQCEGKIVWSVRTKDVKSHRVSHDTGIEFTKVEEKAKIELAAFLESHTSASHS